jgi:predicted nucleic acid-binding protein
VKYLVDANVLGEPTKPRPDPAVVDWLRTHEPELVVNPIVLGELEYGILLLQSGRRRSRLAKWFSEGIQNIRTLELNATTAAVWARLLAELRHKGREMPVKDSLIAASARQHRLIVATRNVAHYQNASVKVVNPFSLGRE